MQGQDCEYFSRPGKGRATEVALGGAPPTMPIETQAARQSLESEHQHDHYN
jgi:hypothetical protein